MALTATVYNFDIDLADADRGCYQTLALRAARHPSESEDYFVVRILAYCLEHAEGIAFSSGVSDPEEPTISVRDLTGAIRVWIEIGAPDAARLHKASKAAARVAVYRHRIRRNGSGGSPAGGFTAPRPSRSTTLTRRSSLRWWAGWRGEWQ